MKSRLITSILSGVFLILSLASTAAAGDKFIIRPLVDTSWTMDSNFYKTETGERSVGTLTFSPGMEFGYTTEKSRVSARGALNINEYEDMDSVPEGMADTDENDYTGHNLTLSADTRLFTRITAGLDDTWIRTRNPAERDEFDNFIDINEYEINRVRPWMRYQISDRFSLGAEFSNILIDYDAGTEEDSTQTGGKTRLYYELNRFTVLDLEYAQWEMDYNMESSDYLSREYRLNFASDFKYFSFTGGLGYHEREFEKPGLNDMDTMSWNFFVKGRNPPMLESDEKPRSYMSAGLAQNFNNAGTRDEYYRADRISLLLGHLFLEKLDAKIEAYYQKSDYENDLLDREDDTYALSGAIAYFLNDWIILTLKTGLESRDSSVSFYDYDNIYLLLKITLNYNLGSK